VKRYLTILTYLLTSAVTANTEIVQKYLTVLVGAATATRGIEEKRITSIMNKYLTVFTLFSGYC
jgi:hypothetical protein